MSRDARTVQSRKDQHLVALPASVRSHLGVVPGTTVYFHVTKAGQVALTTSGKAVGGRPRLEADCPQCSTYRTELDRLRAGGRMREVADYNTAFSQGYQQCQKDRPAWRVEFGTLREGINTLRGDLRQLAGLVADLVEPSPLGLPPGVAAVDVDTPDAGDEPPPPSMESPAPAPSPSEPSGGDAASGGPTPQAAH